MPERHALVRVHFQHLCENENMGLGLGVLTLICCFRKRVFL